MKHDVIVVEGYQRLGWSEVGKEREGRERTRAAYLTGRRTVIEQDDACSLQTKE